MARRLAANDYVDVQISLDGATAEVNDAVRGQGSYATALRAMQQPRRGGDVTGFKISVVMTRHNVGQLDAFKALADRYGAQLRLTRLRPSGRGADVWDELHLPAGQQRALYDWLVANGEGVLTGDSFFHLAGYGEALPGLNLCGAGRVVCLIDPVGDVYACPFAIHAEFLAGNVRDPGGFAGVWRTSDLFAELRKPQTAGPAGPARRTTPAGAGAWPRSSSPGCRSTARTRSACAASARQALAAVRPAVRRGSPVDHSRRIAAPSGHHLDRPAGAPSRTGRATRARWPGWPCPSADMLARRSDVASGRRAGRVRRDAGRPAGRDRAARPAPAAVGRHRHRGRAVPTAGRRAARRVRRARVAVRLQR